MKSEDSETALPELENIIPRQKRCLTGSECQQFENCIANRISKENLAIESVEGVQRSFTIDNVLSAEECAELIQLIDANPDLTFWCQGKEDDASTRSFRNVKTVEIYSHIFAEKIWKRIEGVVPESLEVNVEDENSEDFERELLGRWCPMGLNPDTLFARYPSHGSFAPHTDGRAVVDFNRRSHFSCILYLNSIPLKEGGGTRFYEKSAVSNLKKERSGDEEVWTADPSLIIGEVEAVAGRLLIFYQHLVHEGVPPVDPFSKYIIRSDVISLRTPAICDTEKDQEAYKLFKEGENLVEAGQVDEGVKLFKKAFKLSPLMAQIMGQG